MSFWQFIKQVLLCKHDFKREIHSGIVTAWRCKKCDYIKIRDNREIENF